MRPGAQTKQRASVARSFVQVAVVLSVRVSHSSPDGIQISLASLGDIIILADALDFSLLNKRQQLGEQQERARVSGDFLFYT